MNNFYIIMLLITIICLCITNIVIIYGQSKKTNNQFYRILYIFDSIYCIISKISPPKATICYINGIGHNPSCAGCQYFDLCKEIKTAVHRLDSFKATIN
jgi:hypothetical protein